MIAALAVSTVLVTSTAVVVGTNYVTTQQSAQSALFDTLASGNEKVTAVTQRVADLELAITNAQNILHDSSGKVLDEASRQALEKSIAQAQHTLKLQKAQLVKLKASVSSLKTPAPLDVLWPYGQQLRAQEVHDSDTTSIDALVKAVMALGGGIQNVQAAQAAWQAEQDRIAAEEAAAQAAAAAAPVTQGFSAEAYVTALAPNSYIVWDDGMCARQFGPNVYVCGYATVNLRGSNTDRVPITLDSSLTDRYANSVGVSVLVHEAAHAKQWLKYGPSIMTAYNALVPGQTGSMPVEWMADCATIVKLGYSTGAYTRSCTPEQLAEAATLW